jgi:hypothetical protein
MTLPSFVAVSLFIATAAVASADPSPSPSPSPSPGQKKELKVIGRVRATVCGNIVVHANSAISSALRNDATLSATVTQLRKADFQSDPLTYHRGITQLDAYATELHDNAVRGVGEVKRLRALAQTSKDPVRKSELKAFADALGGALYRQKKAAADLTGFIAYLQARDMRHTPEIERAIATDHMDPPTVRGAPAMEPSPFQLWTDIHMAPNEMAEQAARDFDQRVQEITLDEGTAADHAEGAVSGC